MRPILFITVKNAVLDTALLKLLKMQVYTWQGPEGEAVHIILDYFRFNKIRGCKK